MRRAALVVLLLSLGGCQTIGAMTGGLAPEDAPPPATATVPAPAAAAPQPAPTSASGGLVGMTVETLRSAWGEPALKRTENGAELWQYGGGGSCTLLVYFYANASNVMTVTHAEAVPGGSDEATVAACSKAAGKPSLKPVS